MKHYLLCYFAVALFTSFNAFSDTDKGSKFDTYQELCKYKFLKDGKGITTIQGRDSILRSGHDCNSEYVSSIKRFNRGGKWDYTIMGTGDLPCFAQMRTYPQITLNPDIFKLGDGWIRINYNSHTFWIDSIKDITTEFYPGIPTYQIRIPQIKKLKFSVPGLKCNFIYKCFDRI